MKMGIHISCFTFTMSIAALYPSQDTNPAPHSAHKLPVDTSHITYITLMLLYLSLGKHHGMRCALTSPVILKLQEGLLQGK